MKHFVTLPYLLSMYLTSSGRGFLPLVSWDQAVTPVYIVLTAACAIQGKEEECDTHPCCKFTCLTDYTPASGLSSLGVFVFNSRIVQTRLTIVRNAGHMVLKVTVGYLVARCTENTCLDTMGDTVISFVRLTIQLPVCTRGVWNNVHT